MYARVRLRWHALQDDVQQLARATDIGRFLLRQAAILRTKCVGASHCDTAAALFAVAEARRKCGDQEGSLELHLRAFDVRRR